MPKAGSRSWLGLLRAFGVRGREDLPFPLDLGVKAVIDADRYDPNPHYIVGSRQNAVAGEQGVFEIAAVDVPLWIPRVQHLSVAGQVGIFTFAGSPTAAPGPGTDFDLIRPQGSHGTSARFVASRFTGAAFLPPLASVVDTPVDFGPFALQPGVVLQLTMVSSNQIHDVIAIVEEMGFE